MKEADFKKKVMKDLKNLPSSWWFVKEALAIRGIPDVIGCLNGRLIALELKRDSQAAKGGHVLQRRVLSLIRRAGGIGELIHPEIWDSFYARLKNLENY
jgi:hypothetical protein